MSIVRELRQIHVRHDQPVMVGDWGSLRFDDVVSVPRGPWESVRPGDVVAIIGGFDAGSIRTLLHLIDLPATVMPLVPDTRVQHEYFFEAGGVDVVIEGDSATRIRDKPARHPLHEQLRATGHAGLILFSSGVSGSPKAILHDFSTFLVRFRTRRPALRSLSFLRFDHIGGINTLLHTMYNCGVVITPSGRDVASVLHDIREHAVELLPTTPTFLRMLLLSGMLEPETVGSVRIITHGTEAMDASTLGALCDRLPRVDFRQTYGMSELGILRVKSKARDSLWMRVGGEGVTTRVHDDTLHIRAKNRMLGYLNAPSPFRDGWYDTDDLVQTDGDWIRIVGRKTEVINVGGIKVLPGEIERVALLHPKVVRCRARGAPNPILGQHIEITCELAEPDAIDRTDLRKHFAQHLPEEIRPHRINTGRVAVNHRFKQA